MLVRTRYRFRDTPQRLGWVDPPSKLFPTCGLLAGAERWGYQADPACNGRLTPQGACLPLAQVITPAARPFSSGPSAAEARPTGQLGEAVQMGDGESEQAPI